MIQLVVNGATGRMGQRVCAAADASDDFALIGKTSRHNRTSAVLDTVSNVDLVIDFSSDDGVREAVECCRTHRAALLVCTTGISSQTVAEISSCAHHSPIMIAPNTSRGVAVLTHLLALAAPLLRNDFDVDIIEAHHRGKRDSPSGTALRLKDVVQAAGTAVDEQHMHCIRAGGIVGRHCVQFAADGEVLELSHDAISRDLFATGALDAGRWLVQQQPGEYDIAQAWGLPSTAK